MSGTVFGMDIPAASNSVAKWSSLALATPITTFTTIATGRAIRQCEAAAALATGAFDAADAGTAARPAALLGRVNGVGQ